MKSLGRKCEITGVEKDEYFTSQQDEVKQRTRYTELEGYCDCLKLLQRGIDLVA